MRKPVSALDDDYERIFPPSYNSTKGSTKVAKETSSKVVTKSAIASSENVTSKTNTIGLKH